jgi:predicted permease
LGRGTDSEVLQGPAVNAYRHSEGIFDGFGALYTYRETGADLTDGDVPERVRITRVSAGYFETLGAGPQLGRTFLEEESTPPGEAASGSRYAATRVAVLAHSLWTARYGADPGVLGSTIRLDGHAYEVVGVMPMGFNNPIGPPVDLWTPQDLRTGGSNNWGNSYLSGIGRLADGVPIELAEERLAALQAGLAEQDPRAGNIRPYLVPLQDDVVGATRRTMLWILAGASALVLLSACVNLANLVFARGLGRTRALALRAALGSGRVRQVSHLLTESAALALAGGLLGLALGRVGIGLLLSLAPDALPLGAEPSLSPRVFLFALAATIGSLLLFALAPALRMAGTPAAEVLRSGDRAATSGRGLMRVRDGLVVAQVAVGLVLLAGAGLLGRSFVELRDVGLGVEPEGVLTFEVHLPTARYGDGDTRHAFHELLHERVSALPGVEAVGAVSWLPVNGRYHTWGFQYLPEGGAGDDQEDWHPADMRVIAGDYLGALGIDVVRGVGPDEIDPEGEMVAWVNEAVADQVFAGVDPIGQSVQLADAERRIVGIIENVPFDARGTVSRKSYVLHDQYASDRNWALIQTVRARGDLVGLRAGIREELAGIDPGLVLYRPRPYEDFLTAGRARDRFATALMAAFAALALTLTLVGTYGVLAGSVAGRRREIGIRIALGADTGLVRGMVLRYALALTLPGIVLGLVGAWVGSRWIRSLLFEVQPADPAVLGLTVATFLGVGLLAGWLPARRATRVDPARTLAEE